MGPGPTRSIKMKCGAREDDQGEPSGGGPLGGEAFAAVHAQAVRGIERQDPPLPAAHSHHDLIVGVDTSAIPLHDADQDWTVPGELAIEIGELALEDEGLQTLAAREVAQGRRADALLGRGRVGGDDAFAHARERPVTEHHRQRGGTTVLARYLAYRRDAFHHVPAVAWVREVDGRRGPRRAEIAAARQDTADERERSCADRV